MKHSYSAYTHGCRCWVCTEANRVHQQEYKRSIGVKPRPEARTDDETRAEQRARARIGRDYIQRRRVEEGPCVRCGSDERLEFDHIDSDTKTVNVSRMQGWSEPRIEAEIAKCQVLCKPCHVAKTIEMKEYR